MTIPCTFFNTYSLSGLWFRFDTLPAIRVESAKFTSFRSTGLHVGNESGNFATLILAGAFPYARAATNPVPQAARAIPFYLELISPFSPTTLTPTSHHPLV